MVISSSNRSPSPISMRLNPSLNPNPNNSNSRNDQERERVGVRTSFSGYPFAKSPIVTHPRSFTSNTPADSPAEYARRNSFGGECGNSFLNHEQKENKRDPNSKLVGRTRSPLISKGNKHFMSPTFSAASKINPSPRKKVLGERNEAIRTSASLADGKFYFFSKSALDFADDNESKSEMESPLCSIISDFSRMGNEVSTTDLDNNVADLSPRVGKIESDPDLVVHSPEIPLNTTNNPVTVPQSDMPKIVVDDNEGLDVKKSVTSSPSVIAPLNADPLHSPYDPKTNLLSPRPQFLHYKPNPRVNSYINKVLRLEEDLTSDSLSETENSDEVQSETSLEVHGDSSFSVGTYPVDDQPTSSELSSSKSQELEETAESTIEMRRGFSGKWKAITFLFLILLGSVSFSMYSSRVGNAINQEKLFSQIYSNSRIAADLAKANFNGLFLNVKVLSTQSVGYLSQKISQAIEIKYSQLPYSNLTGWQEGTGDYPVNGFEFRSWLDRKEDDTQETVAKTDIFGDAEELKLENHETDKHEQSAGLLPCTDKVIEEHQPEEQEQSSVPENSVPKDENAIVEMTDEASLFDEPQKQEESHVLVDEESAVEITEEVSLLDKGENKEAEQNHKDDMVSAVRDESQSYIEAEDKESLVSPDTLSRVTTANVPFSDAGFESESVEGVKSVSKSLVLEAAEKISLILEATERSLAPTTAAISLVVVSLLAATAFMFVKNPKNETSTVSTPSADHVVHQGNSTFIPVASKPDPKDHEDTYLRGPVEVDMVGEFCPSELSSFQKTASYYKRGSDEAHSMEKSFKRDHKRESLASSSSEYTISASYGSFTTSNIVYSKQRDNEVVTPVRRSSRIRSKGNFKQRDDEVLPPVRLSSRIRSKVTPL